MVNFDDGTAIVGKAEMQIHARLQAAGLAQFGCKRGQGRFRHGIGDIAVLAAELGVAYLEADQ